MGDNLHDLNRKELKELCSQNNIRTAGVKHEDLVRLLRNKLYPSTPQSSRAMKGRGPKVLSPGKEDGDSYKTPGKTAGKARGLRSVTLAREDVTQSSRKPSGLSRKPLLTKSNTMQARRPPDLGMKSIGVEHDAQENFVRRLCQINGVSPLSRRGLEATGKPSRLSLAHSDSKSEGMASPRPSELSDGGSDASRRVSEIATDAGPDTMSDFGSDADDFRSVSSEPMSKLSSIGKRNASRTESQSKLSLLSGHSFLTPGTSWGTGGGDDHSRTMDNLLADGDRKDSTEIIFPEFSEGSNFLVGDTDALDLSFLHAGAADPDVIVNKKEDKDKFDVMESPMARDYVTYNRGSEADISDGNSIGASRPSIGETSIEQRNSPAETKEVKHEHVEPRTDDCVDGPEIHSTLPCLESHSPPFDSKDYSVAKKLVFEPEEDVTLPSPLQDDVQGPEVSDERSVVPVPEENDHEPATSSETPPPTNEDTSSEEVSHFQDGEGTVPETVEERHSTEEPAVNGDTALSTIEDTSLEEVNESNSQNIEEPPVPKTSEVRHSVEELTMNGETPPSTIEDTSSEEVNGSKGEEPVPKSIDGRYSVVLSIEDLAVNGETPSSTTEEVDGSNGQNGEEGPVSNALEEKDSALDLKVSEPAANDDVAETLPSTMKSISSDMTNGESGFKEEFDSQPHQQESDTKVPSETEHQDTAIVERHVDVPSVAKIASDKAAPEPDEQEGCPGYEQGGSDVKVGDGLSASTSTTIVVNKEEDKQVKIPFPLSLVMWCSQVCCSPVSRNRRPPMLGS